MTPESAAYLNRSQLARAVVAVLRRADLSVPQLARVMADRASASAIGRCVLELRRLDLVRWSGRRWRRAKQWMA
jgi:hypothetical protein